MYRDYRPKWAAFKCALMALKLVNVLAVTIITKDNCLFRGRTRLYIDVVRSGTVLAFMGSWMLLEMWARPFIDALSNNSGKSLTANVM